MDNQTQSFSPDQSLKLINDMINRSKQSFTALNFFFIMWGWLLFAAGIGEYLLMHTYSYEHPYIVWPIVGIVGGILASVYGYKKDKESKTKNYLDRLFNYLWITFAVTLVLIIGAAVSSEVNPSPFVMILTGLPTFITGKILKFKPLMAGGIIFWILGIILFFGLMHYASLIFSTAIVFGYIIPGYLLRKEEKHV